MTSTGHWVLAFFCLSLQARASSWEKVERSTVKVVSQACRGAGKRSEGSGILVDDIGGRLQVLTTLHAMQYTNDEADNPICYTVSSPWLVSLGFPKNAWSFDLTATDWAYDLALLTPKMYFDGDPTFWSGKLRSPLGRLIEWPLRRFLNASDVNERFIDITNIVVRNGETLVSMGYPAGSEELMVDSKFQVRQHQAENNRVAAMPHMIEAIGQAEFGMSGGPVFTTNGELVGLLSGKRPVDRIEIANIGIVLDWWEVDARGRAVFQKSSETPNIFCFSQGCWERLPNGILKLTERHAKAANPSPRRSNRIHQRWQAIADLVWSTSHRDLVIPFFLNGNELFPNYVELQSFVEVYRRSDDFYPAVFSQTRYESVVPKLRELLSRCEDRSEKWYSTREELKPAKDARFREAEPYYKAQAIVEAQRFMMRMLRSAIDKEPTLLAALDAQHIRDLWDNAWHQAAYDKLSAASPAGFEFQRRCALDLANIQTW